MTKEEPWEQRIWSHYFKPKPMRFNVFESIWARILYPLE
jgi:hypothetical protein